MNIKRPVQLGIAIATGVIAAVVVVEVRQHAASTHAAAVQAPAAQAPAGVVPTEPPAVPGAPNIASAPRKSGQAPPTPAVVAHPIEGSDRVVYTIVAPRLQLAKSAYDMPRDGDSAARLPESATIAPLPNSVAGHPELPPGVAYASDKDPVQIVSVEIEPSPVHLGGTVNGRVMTSSNAASVTAQFGAFRVNVPKIAPGTFALQARVPRVPWWHRQIDVVIIAVRTDGATISAVIPVDLAL